MATRPNRSYSTCSKRRQPRWPKWQERLRSECVPITPLTWPMRLASWQWVVTRSSFTVGTRSEASDTSSRCQRALRNQSYAGSFRAPPRWAPLGCAAWANGRVDLRGDLRRRDADWTWHCAPLDEWDGSIPRRKEPPLNRFAGRGELRQEAVAGSVDFGAAISCQLGSHQSIVSVEYVAPPVVAQPHRFRGRADKSRGPPLTSTGSPPTKRLVTRRVAPDPTRANSCSRSRAVRRKTSVEVRWRCRDCEARHKSTPSGIGMWAIRVADRRVCVGGGASVRRGWRRVAVVDVHSADGPALGSALCATATEPWPPAGGI
jgi:hypothetical protein